MKGFVCDAHRMEELIELLRTEKRLCHSPMKLPASLLPKCLAVLSKQLFAGNQGALGMRQARRALTEQEASGVAVRNQKKGPERSCCVLHKGTCSLAG